jgi:large subunit ribosomal protein L13
MSSMPIPTADQRRWVVIDASGQVLGRLAARVASILRGKDKPTFAPHVDGGDFVVVVNAAKVRLTGRKLEQKRRFRHSGYPGGLKEVTYERLMQTHPERVVEYAVKGMLPNTPLGRRMFRKLKVYSGADHPHRAQRPAPADGEAAARGTGGRRASLNKAQPEGSKR